MMLSDTFTIRYTQYKYLNNRRLRQKVTLCKISHQILNERIASDLRQLVTIEKSAVFYLRLVGACVRTDWIYRTLIERMKPFVGFYFLKCSSEDCLILPLVCNL